MKHLRRFMAAIVGLGALAAIATPAHAFVWQSCNQWDSWTSGIYTVYCDEWGATSGQCLGVNSASSWTSTSNFTGGGIKAYPNTSVLPNTSLSSLSSYTSSWAFTVPSSGAEYDVAYDVWTGGSADEIMIWEKWSSGVGPISSSYGCSGNPATACPIFTNQTIGGQTYNVYRGNVGHNVVSFLHTSQRSSGTEDILAIMNWCSSHGLLANTTLYQVQFGVEITSTTGSQNFSLTSYSVSSSAGGGSTNLALNKTATSDSNQTGHLPNAANDGNNTTRWTAVNGTLPRWWKVDLGASHNLTKTIVMFEGASVWKYKIETSPDNSTWTTRVDKTGNTVNAQTYTDNFSASARYVRITVTGQSNNWWASIFEMQVIGS